MLFDKQGIYDIENIPMEFELTLNKDNKDFLKVYDLKEALTKGNLFPNLYDSYKGLIPKEIISTNEKDKFLNEIRMLIFGINDLNLYLDLNPEDTYAYNLFKDYTNKLKEKETKFNSLYEPLNLCDLKETYEWLNSWPWEVKNV